MAQPINVGVVSEKPRSARQERIKYSQQQLDQLAEYFKENRYPTQAALLHLSRCTGVDMKRLQTWFKNRRAFMKRGLREANSAPPQDALFYPQSLQRTSGGHSSSVPFPSPNQSPDAYEPMPSTSMDYQSSPIYWHNPAHSRAAPYSNQDETDFSMLQTSNCSYKNEWCSNSSLNRSAAHQLAPQRHSNQPLEYPLSPSETSYSTSFPGQSPQHSEMLQTTQAPMQQIKTETINDRTQSNTFLTSDQNLLGSGCQNQIKAQKPTHNQTMAVTLPSTQYEVTAPGHFSTPQQSQALEIPYNYSSQSFSPCFATSQERPHFPTAANTHTNSQNTYTNPPNTHPNPSNTYPNPPNTYPNPLTTYPNTYPIPPNTHPNSQNTYTNPLNTHPNPPNTYPNPPNTYPNPPNTHPNLPNMHPDPPVCQHQQYTSQPNTGRVSPPAFLTLQVSQLDEPSQYNDSDCNNNYGRYQQYLQYERFSAHNSCNNFATQGSAPLPKKT